MLLPSGDQSRWGGAIMSIQAATPLTDTFEALVEEYRQ
jgi:hypothetical protein